MQCQATERRRQSLHFLKDFTIPPFVSLLVVLDLLHVFLLVFPYLFFFSPRSVNCSKIRNVTCNESLVGLGLPFFPLRMDSNSSSHCSAVDLLALLKWKAYPDRVMDILGRLRHVSGEEIVKVLHEITVFGCICDGESRPAAHFLNVPSYCTF